MRLFRLFAVLCFCVCLCLPSAAWAAEDADFSCKGLFLGDSEEQMRAAFGEPLFDREASVLGLAVTYYWFGDGYEVGVSSRTHRVVDMRITDEKYQARAGVRYGATAYKIQATFGRQKKQMIDGEMYYVYGREGHAAERLVLKIDSENGSLVSFRITSLPLTAEEAEAWETEELSADALDDGEDARGLDMTGMPKEEPAVLSIGG